MQPDGGHNTHDFFIPFLVKSQLIYKNREKEVDTIVIEVKEVYNTTSYLKNQIP